MNTILKMKITDSQYNFQLQKAFLKIILDNFIFKYI